MLVDLTKMNSAQLEAEADRLLYGKEVKRLSKGLAAGYFKPKHTVSFIKCEGCGKLRSALSARFCHPCYMIRTKKYKEIHNAPLGLPETGYADGDLVIVHEDIEEPI